jgi:hypothetical protein
LVAATLPTCLIARSLWSGKSSTLYSSFSRSDAEEYILLEKREQRSYARKKKLGITFFSEHLVGDRKRSYASCTELGM